MQRIFTVPIYIQGTLAANHTAFFTFPFDVQLVAVSLNNSTANAGTCKIGKGGSSADDDAYLAAENFGVSDTPVVKCAPSDFDGATAGGQFPHIAANQSISVTITDHASHMAAAMVVLTFTEG
jgi:hypothetical protein